MWCKYSIHVEYYCYDVIINKCDETPAYVYFSTSLSLIILFILKKFIILCHWSLVYIS